MNFVDIQTEYFFGENKEGQKVVTCKLTAYLDCYNNADINGATSIANAVAFKDGDRGWYTFYGKTRLSKGDTYDEELGKKIAESKAKKAMFKKLLQFTKSVNDIITQLQDANIRQYEKFSYCLEKEIEHYANLTGNTAEEEV